MERMKALGELAALLPPLPDEVLAGVSGGADSVALLHLLLLRGCRVTAVHVNHGLRGESSDGDERFVRALCEELGVACKAYRAVPPEHPGEGWAREARYGFFLQAARETGCHALVLAHHRDDQAETMLLHLLRGAGLTGLAGMAAESERDGLHIFRPLLGFSRQQLRDALTEDGQTWREDESNADTRYLRNAVRHELLPMMERMAPGASGRIADAAWLLRREEDAMQAEAETALAACTGHTADIWWARAAALQHLPEALQVRVLRGLWMRAAGSGMEEHGLSMAQTEGLTALVNAGAGARCNLPGGWHGVRGWKCVHLVPPMRKEDGTEVPVDEAGAALGGVRLQCMPAMNGQMGNGRDEQTMPRAQLSGCVLRYPRPGDWLIPFGHTRRVTLRDYLVRRHVDAPFRMRLPLLCRGDEVLLVAGVGAGSVPKIEEVNEESDVFLRWQGDLPWAEHGA